MNDENLIQSLDHIRKECGEQGCCGTCKFHVNYDDGEECTECQIMLLVKKMYECEIPFSWNLEELEKIIKM